MKTLAAYASEKMGNVWKEWDTKHIIEHIAQHEKISIVLNESTTLSTKTSLSVLKVRNRSRTWSTSYIFGFDRTTWPESMHNISTSAKMPTC